VHLTNISDQGTRLLRRWCALAAIALVGLVAACGNVAPVSSGQTGAEAAFPVTIEHKYGTTVIPEAL